MLIYLRNLLGFSAKVFEDQAAYELETGLTSGRIAAVAAHLDSIEVVAAMGGTESTVQKFREIIELALVPAGTGELHEEAVKCLLELMAALPQALAPVYMDRLNWLKPFIFSSQESTRENAGRLVGFIAAELEPEQFTALVDDLAEVIKPLKQNRLEDRHGGLAALGFVLSSMFRQPEEWRPLAPEAVQRSLALIVRQLEDSDSLIVCAACKALGALGQVTALPFAEEDEVEDAAALDDAAARTNGEAAAPAAAPALTKTGVIKKLLKLCVVKTKSKSTRINEAAILCLGSLSIGEFPHTHFEVLLRGLCAVAEVKNIELQFSVGQALCSTAVGPLCTVALDTWYPTVSTDDGDDGAASKKPRIEQTRLSATLEQILKRCAYHPQSWTRQASAIWLVSILKHCGALKEVGLWLEQIQGVFTNLLSEGDEFAQDIASKGLGLLYEIGDKATKKELVRVLVETLSEGKKSQARKFDNNNSDETVFAAGELGAAPSDSNAGTGQKSGSISTYKELCGIASDLNQPDLIYKFMQLANHNTMWNSRKGAAFGFATIASQAREELAAFLPDLVPKLYRYCFDPNPAVHTAMTNIWKTVVIEPAKAIDQYIFAILDDLCKSITNGQWRIREACCGAISDLLRGRRWPHLKKHIVLLWEMLFRALDDVKESVRLAAFSACKRLGKTTITLCSAEDGDNSKEAVAAALPCLINTGLLSQVDEVRNFSMGVMIELSKEAGPALRPHITSFMMVLLEALSGMENQVLNYVATRIDNSDRMQDTLENARISASKSGPISECINRLLDFADVSVLPEIVPPLCDLLRRGLGSATKSGCAHVAGRLAAKFRQELNEHAKPLLKALLHGAVQKSAPVRRDFANAIGQVVRAAPAADVDMVVRRCHKMYLERSSDEAIETSAAICRGIAVQAPDVLTAVAAQVFPIAYVGMHDANTVTRMLWAELWNDNTPGDSGGIKLYAGEIIQLALPCLADRSWDVKKQGAAALTAVANNAYKGAMNDYLEGVVEALTNALEGRTWEGKEMLLQALVAASVSCMNHLKVTPALQGTIHGVVLKELRKRATEYRIVVLPAAAKYLRQFNDPAVFSEVADMLVPVLLSDGAEDGDVTDTEKIKKAAKQSKDKLGTEILSLFLAALESEVLPRLEPFTGFWSGLRTCLVQSEWRNKARVSDCIRQLFQTITKINARKADGVAPGMTENDLIDYGSVVADTVLDTLKILTINVVESKQTVLRLSGLSALKAVLEWLLETKDENVAVFAAFVAADLELTRKNVDSLRQDDDLAVSNCAEEAVGILKKLASE